MFRRVTMYCYIKRKDLLIVVLVCVVGCILISGCNADASTGSLVSLKLDAELEILPEGADISAKTDKGHQAELEHGKVTVHEIQLEKFHAKNGLLEKKQSILARDNQ